MTTHASPRPLAVATKVSRLRAVKAFLQWLAGRPGYSRKLAYPDMEYFNHSNNEGRIAGAVGTAELRALLSGPSGVFAPNGLMA